MNADECEKYVGYRHIRCVVDKVLNAKWAPDARGP
jgi:hypothetical protein